MFTFTDVVCVFPASSVTLIVSVPASEMVSPDLTSRVSHPSGVNVTVTAQLVETSSLQLAAFWPPMIRLLPNTVTSAPAITLNWVDITVTSGAVVSCFLQPNKTIAASNNTSSIRPVLYVLSLKKSVRQYIILHKLKRKPCGYARHGLRI